MRMGLRALVLAMMVCVGCCDVVAQAAAKAPETPCVSSVTGTLDVFEMTSKVFGNSRELRVWTPPGYADEANKGTSYPVLYVFDGQNVYDVCTSYGHKEWRVDETLTRLIAEGKVAPMIVVGIDHMGPKRAYEWLAWPDNVQDPGSGPTAGNLLPEFMAKDVMPVIAAKYRVKKGPENTGVAGSSYGGMASLYLGVMAPTVFGKVIGESPCFGWGMRRCCGIRWRFRRLQGGRFWAMG